MNQHSIHVKDESSEAAVARFLRSAKACRTRDLEQLSVVGELVKDLGSLIHALQKERGVSSIYLGSNGSQFADRLASCIAECHSFERGVRDRLEHVDQQLDRMASGARFYTRVAQAFQALDALVVTRQQIATLTLVPQDAVKAFTDIIGSLLAVVFEAADIAADPDISRALVALVNFIQGKEYAGQERATAGAAFSRGRFDAVELRRLNQLIAAQDQALHIFLEFAEPSHVGAVQSLLDGPYSSDLERMRKIASKGGLIGELADVNAEIWYDVTTRRINDMKNVEDRLTADLKTLCAAKLAEIAQDGPAPPDSLEAAPKIALTVEDYLTSLDEGAMSGVGLYAQDTLQPKLMRSILDVVQAQSRRLRDLNTQLESVRTDLNERKIIERAKGLLMTSRSLTEQQAYTLMRQTAMNQNRRIFDIAETIVSMAEILNA